MGMKAMYLTEVKTRLLPLEKEIKRLAELVEKASATEKTRYATSIKEFQTRFAGIQEDLALLQSVDEGEWGEFSTAIDEAIHRLIHDADALMTELKKQMAFA